MKQIKIFFLIIISIFTVTLIGCSSNSLSNTAKILPPQNSNMPLIGVWVTDKYFPSPSSSSDTSKINTKMGNIVSFNTNSINFYNTVCEHPKYKIKTVNSENYFVGNYSVSPQTLGITKSNVQILTITCNENFLASFTILDDNTILTYIDGIFYRLSKNDQLSHANINKNNVLDTELTIDKNSETHSVEIKENPKPLIESNILEEFNSGILLGLKSYKDTSYNNIVIKQPEYRTLWINFIGDSVHRVQYLPFILAPRPNGFWKIGTLRNISETSIIDLLYAYPILKTSKINSGINELSSYNLIDITYVGSDYISLDLSKIENFKSKNPIYKNSILQIQPLDTLTCDNSSSISLDKLMGEQGINAIKQGAATFLNSLNYTERKKLESIPKSNNFGIIRKDGKWILVGRLNASSNNDKNTFKDFNIPIMTPKELVRYDSLHPTWDVIKKRVPNALDAYSPPNEKFVIVLTKSKILIYTVTNNILAKNPLKSIPLKDNESVVMSQWATGKYVKNWDNQVTSLLKK